MPLEVPGWAHLGLLLLVLPTQYFISSYFGAPATGSDNQDWNRMVAAMSSFKERYLSLGAWQRRLKEWVLSVASLHQSRTAAAANKAAAAAAVRGNKGLDAEESPALEVLNYRNQNGYFADSMEPRSPRSSGVKYRVGQVVRHKVHGYRGVIIGWDPLPKAPNHWLKNNHPKNKRMRLLHDVIAMLHAACAIQQHWRNMACYLILVDIRDRPRAQKTYVVEENIEIVSGVQIYHPELDEYFEHFDAIQYLPRPRLKALYPHD